MGFYTDWFLADESEAHAIAESESPFQDWPCLSMKSIAQLELTHLWAVLRGEPDSLDGAARDGRVRAACSARGQTGPRVVLVVKWTAMHPSFPLSRPRRFPSSATLPSQVGIPYRGAGGEAVRSLHPSRGKPAGLVWLNSIR